MTHMTYPADEDLGGRIDAIGWGLFFLISGVLLLVPGLPEGSWLLVVGLLFLSLAAVRSIRNLPVSGFGVIVGALMAVWGLGTMAGVAVPWFSLLLVLCGVAIVVGELPRPRHAA